MKQNQAKQRRVIAIGLEALDPDLVDSWCDDGQLPVLSSLRERGTWRRLRSTTEISSGTAWSSLTSGVGPGGHSSFFFHRQLQSGSYNIVKKYADEIFNEPVWMRLSDTGHRVAVIEVPGAKLHDGINGVEILSWGAQAPNLNPQLGTPSYLDELNAQFGQHPLAGWYETKPGTAAECDAFLTAFRNGIESRTAMGKWVLDREPWDFFIMVYPEGHTVGHVAYHLFDETHPDHDPDIVRRSGNPLLEIYREIDRGIGALIADEDDATVLVFSNSGMGPNYSGIHLVGAVLDRLGFGPQATGKERRKSPIRALMPSLKWGPYAIKEVEDLVGPQNIQRAKKLFPKRFWDRWSRRMLAMGNEWKNSRAFAVPNDSSGAIRINVKGREPNGLIEPGAEYAAVCDKLIEEFSALINPATGQPAVDKILKGDDVCAGPYRDDFPDLIVVWNREAPIEALQSERIGTVNGHLPDRRTGAHKVDGFLISCGPALVPGGVAEDASILDVAPTILEFLGQAIPDTIKGRPLDDICNAGAGPAKAQQVPDPVL